MTSCALRGGAPPSPPSEGIYFLLVLLGRAGGVVTENWPVRKSNLQHLGVATLTRSAFWKQEEGEGAFLLLWFLATPWGRGEMGALPPPSLSASLEGRGGGDLLTERYSPMFALGTFLIYGL